MERSIVPVGAAGGVHGRGTEAIAAECESVLPPQAVVQSGNPCRGSREMIGMFVSAKGRERVPSTPDTLLTASKLNPLDKMR